LVHFSYAPADFQQRSIQMETQVVDVAQPTGTKRRLMDDYAHEDAVALELKVKKRTLRGWCRNGTGPPYVVLRREFWFHRQGFADWLRKRLKIPRAS
jgi:hypothetical protein